MDKFDNLNWTAPALVEKIAQYFSKAICYHTKHKWEKPHIVDGIKFKRCKRCLQCRIINVRKPK